MRKDTILFATSVSWLFNAKRAFRFGKPMFGIVTSICSLVSANLWRNYDYKSVRRTIDICTARATGVYYAFLFTRKWCHKEFVKTDLLKIVFTNACYLMSSCVFKNHENTALLFHTLFHSSVYELQSDLLLL